MKFTIYLFGLLMFLTLILNVNAEVFISNELKYSIVDSGSYINMVVYNASGIIEKKTIDKMSLSGSLGYEIIKNKVEFEVNNVKENDIIADVKGLKYIKYDMVFVSNCKNCSLINDNGLIKVHFLTEKELNDNENIFIDSKSYVISIPSLNNSFYNTSLPSFSFTVINDSVSYSCNLFIDGVNSGVNETVINNTLSTIISNTSIDDGLHYFKIECINTSINDTSSTYYFTVDTIYPILTKNFINPLINTYSNQSFNFINFTIQDPNFNYLVYRFNNKTLNTSGLVLGMNFDNNFKLGESDTKAYDFSGNGNNGTINGAVYTIGKYGNALSFDGSNDIVSVADASSLESHVGANGVMTIEAWVNPSSISATHAIVGKYESSNNIREYIFSVNNITGSNYLRMFVCDILGSNCLMYRSNGTVSLGVWTHAAVVFDNSQSGGANKIKFYINGLPQTSVDAGSTGTFTLMNDTNARLTVGAANVPAPITLFNGTIDEVRIYNRALTANEVLLSYYSNFHVNNFSSYDFFSNYSTVSGRSVYNISVFDKANNLNFSGDYNIFLNVENYLYPCNYSDYEDIVVSLTAQLNSCNGELGNCNNTLLNMTDLYNNCTLDLNNTNLSLIECELNLSECNNSNSSYIDCMSNLSSCNEDLTAMNLTFLDCELNYSNVYNDSLACNTSLNICNLNLSDYALNLTICENNLTACGVNLTACLNATCILSGAGLTDSSFIILLLIILFIMFLLLRLR